MNDLKESLQFLNEQLDYVAYDIQKLMEKQDIIKRTVKDIEMECTKSIK